MSKPKMRTFEFDDGTEHNAAVSGFSASLQSCYKYNWSLVPILTGTTSNDATYTVEVSNDNINWFEYNNLSTDVSVEDAVDDIHLAWIYLRIVYNAKTESTGTIRFELTQKVV